MIEIKGMITMALFDWEQRKFESLIYPEKIKNKNNLQLPAYSISNKNGFIAQTAQFGKDNTYSKTDKKTNYIVNSGAFAYNPARINVGSIGYQNLATPVLVSSLYEVFKTNSQINDLFLIYWFKTDKFFNQIKKYEEGGVRQYYFLDKLLFSEIIIPKDAREQQKISKILKKLDYLISLQQRKLEQINLLNQAMLQQMFANKDVPKIRFKEFKSIWEHRKLDSLAEFSKGKGYSKKDLITKGKPIILYGQLYTKYQTIIKKIDTFAKTNKESVISRGREVIVPASGETADDISRASVVDKAGIIIGGDLNIIRPYSIISPIFLAFTLSNGTQRKELSKYAQGKSVVHLHNADLKNVNVFLPTMEEQSKINSILSELNELNLLSKNKLAILQAIKNALLQIMFV